MENIIANKIQLFSLQILQDISGHSKNQEYVSILLEAIFAYENLKTQRSLNCQSTLPNIDAILLKIYAVCHRLSS